MDKKQLYGLIGHPVAHSLSPKMQMAAFKALGIDAEYKLFDVEPAELEDFLLREAFRLDLSGFNITIPYKVKAREILEKKFPLKETGGAQNNLYYVKLSGAVNTVKMTGETLTYYNTDASGFLRSLRESLKFDPQGKEILLIGCGGAGRAIIAALSWRDIGTKKIYIYDIDRQSMKAAREHFLSDSPHSSLIAEKLHFITARDLPGVIKSCSLLVNASPVGMEDANQSPLDTGLLHKDLYLYDIVYNKKGKTRLLCDARAPAIGGREMLLYQGADAFELWTGREAPVEVMRREIT